MTEDTNFSQCRLDSLIDEARKKVEQDSDWANREFVKKVSGYKKDGEST